MWGQGIYFYLSHIAAIDSKINGSHLSVSLCRRVIIQVTIVECSAPCSNLGLVGKLQVKFSIRSDKVAVHHFLNGNGCFRKSQFLELDLAASQLIIVTTIMKIQNS